MVSVNPATPATLLAPWMAAQLRELLTQRGHAWLLSGPSGLGQYELGLALVRAWLCEQPSDQGACGHCTSCHAIEVHAHADLCMLMPETVMLELGWPLSEKAQDEIDSKKRKPSKEIRIEAIRDALEFAQRTSARGRGKAVLVFPAERMNVYSANALLKTLEEPVGEVRFVLATEAAHQLLPTIRSRCQLHQMVWPKTQQAMDWLQQQGLSTECARVALRAAGARAQDALAFADLAATWHLLPQAVKRGDIAVFKDWSALQTIDALQKLCHDMMAVSCGASPRFFAPTDLPRSPAWTAMNDWSKALAASRRTAEHPFQAGLMLEALVSQAQLALNSAA